MKTLTSLLCLLLIAILTCDAQNTVPSSLYASTHWTTAGSPYIVSGNTVLFTDTLTIDPGVTVKFNAGASLEIRGYLYAHGSPGDTIEFTSNDPNPQAGSWVGIKIRILTGTVTPLRQVAMSYCKGSYAHYFLDFQNAYNGPYFFKHCYFAHNDLVSTNTDAGVSPVVFDSCAFYANDVAVSGGGITASYCSFINNRNGVDGISDSYYCYFSGNTGLAVATNGATVGCTIINNKIAYENYFGSVNDSFINNYVVDNDTGVIVKSYFNGYVKFTGNTFCNRIYNIVMRTANPADLSRNCWCSTDSATIRSKIYDGYADNAYGLVEFDPLDTQCAYALGNTELPDHDLFSIAPNPFSDNLFIKNTSGQRLDFDMYDLDGKLLLNTSMNDSAELTTSFLAPGIYIYEIQSGNKRTQGKVVKY